MSKIIVENYTKILSDKEVLKNINYIFESGMIYDLYGRNGSGKTMLLRALAGMIYATSGQIRYDDKVLHKDIDFPEDTGIIIETMSLLPQYDAFTNLKMLSMIRHIASEEDIKQTLEDVGLNPSDKKKVKTYSLGMKQKLVIAQALFEKPKVLLLDEPTNALDEISIYRIRDLFKKLRDTGCIIIIASHNKEDIDCLCDKVLIMKSGELSEKQE